MIKIHYQDDQDGLLELCQGHLTTLIEPGVKQAESCAFPPDVLSAHAPDKDHFLLHVVAMGDYETYGFNRNGDAFSKKANQTYHPTFVSHGHFYREHRNRDPETQGIGKIAASAHNDDMGRVELLVHGHKKKAEEEYQMAKEGKQLSVSMSCRVKEDRCSCCQNKAASRYEYCSHLKHHMLRYLPEFEKYAFAYNDDPTFFDISRVRNPADRIAHFLEYRFPGEKAASSSDRVITGSEWAEFEGYEQEAPAVSGQKLLILQKLAQEEQWLETEFEDPSPKSEFAKTASAGWKSELTEGELTQLRQLDAGTMFRKLAQRKILLPLGSFCAWVKNSSVREALESDLYKEALSCMPGVFRLMLKQPTSSGMQSLCDAGTDLQTSYYGGGRDDIVQQVMDSVSERFSTDPSSVRNRVIFMSVKGASAEDKTTPVKEKTLQGEGLALAYGHYKVSALTDMFQYVGLNAEDYLHAVLQNQTT